MSIFDQLTLWARYNKVTATLIALSVTVSVISSFGGNLQYIIFLFISENYHGLTEIFNGQLWRLFTPALIHFGILHIAFNMLWLYQLGSAIEQRQKSKRLLLLVLIISFLSNIAEYFWSGPLFGGMSGVVYGLLAYVWVQGKFNPRSGLWLDQTTTIMMLIWFVVCWLGLIGNIANMAHTIGLLCGLLLGLIYSPNIWRSYK